MTQHTAPTTAGAKSRSNLVLLVVLVLVLSGGGAGAYWMYAHRSTSPATPAPVEHGIVSFDTFVVNLADPGGTRFLRVTLSLLVEGVAAAAEVEEDQVAKTRVRSAILELLTQQNADRLTTPDGKTELKKAIAERSAEALEHAKVTDVLFTEFVVQY